MTHSEQCALIKEAVLGRMAGALGKGLTTSFKNFTRGWRRIGGDIDQGIGYLTKNPERVSRGAATVAKNTPTSVSGSFFNPKTWPARFKGSWGAQDAGVKGFAEHAAYAAGRAPAILTYGGALGFAPMVAGEYAGSAHGAAAASKNLKNVAYDEIARSMQRMENTPFMERMRIAHNPQGFAEGMLTQGDAIDAHSLDAYNRMFNPEAPTAGGVGAFAKDFALRSMPIGGFFQGQNGFVPDRNWIENKAADMMAQRVREMLPAKTASLNVDMVKSSNLVSKGVGMLTTRLGKVWTKLRPRVAPNTPPPLPPLPKTPPPLPKTPPPLFRKTPTSPHAGVYEPAPGLRPAELGPPVPVPAMATGKQFALRTAGAYALPLGFFGLGYAGSKGHTESDMYQQARGTARAVAADQWMQLSPMERYLAAAFPTAAKMKMEQKLGPEYSQYYQQTFGAPGETV